MEKGVAERHLVCSRCHRIIYPQIAPAVIVGVIDGDRILMTRYARRGSGLALIAGFTEIGETVEETVRREVMEEVGVRVKDITFYKSQPWAFSGTLLMGFYAQLDGDDTLTVDTRELSEAFWVKRDAIDVANQDLSLTNEMICQFAAGKENIG